MIEHKVTYILYLKSGKYYIGSSCEFPKRLKRHLYELERGIHHCKPFQQEWNKTPGIDRIVTISKSTEKEIRNMEQSLLNQFKDSAQLLNVGISAIGGDNLSRNPNRAEIIEKMTNSVREMMNNLSDEEKKTKFGLPGELNPMYGKTHTPQARRLISLASTGNRNSLGRKLSPEQIAKLSEAGKLRTGSKNSFYGRNHSEATRKILSERMKGSKPPNMRCVRIGERVFESVTEAARNNGVATATILHRIKSKNPRFDSYEFV